MTFLRGDTAAAETFADLAAPPDALARLDRSFAGLPSASGTLPTLGGLPSASGMRVSQATSLQVSTVYSCVRIRSRDLARCRPQIQRVDATGNRAIVAGHPLAPLFTRPNRLQTWFEFAEQMHVAFLLRSNAYAVILRDWRGQPTELIPVNPDLVTPLEAPDASIFYNISRAGLWLAAVLEPVDIAVPDYDVLHVRDLTFNSIVGVSRIALARDAIGLALVQEQQASRWAGNGARPAGVLQSKKQLSAEAAGRLKASWDALQSGIANVGRTAVLEDGIEWHPMSLSSVDLEFMQARLTQVKEIARFWEVPLHKLGENEGLPRASIGELNADYVQNVVMSDATRYEQRIAMTFGIGDDLEVKFDEHELLRADLATMMNSARTGVLSGLLTQNEGRNYIGYGPLPNADTLLAPVNLAPNGSAADGVAPDGAGRPRDAELPGGAKMIEAKTIEAIAAAVAARLKYNADQARDDHGRFAADLATSVAERLFPAADLTKMRKAAQSRRDADSSFAALTVDQVVLIRDYAGFGFAALNKDLRRKSQTKAVLQQRDALNGALAAAGNAARVHGPVDRSIIVNSPDKEAEFYRDVMASGSRVRFKAFTSTAEGGDIGGRNLRFKIQANGGGVRISSISGIAAESEVLFPAGAMFKVTGVVTRADHVEISLSDTPHEGGAPRDKSVEAGTFVTTHLADKMQSGDERPEEVDAAVVKARLKSNPNHDAQGRFSSGDGDGEGVDAGVAAAAEDHAAVSHEIRLVVKGLAITAAAAIAVALLPEEVVGATTASLVAGAAAIAENVAGGMFVEAGISATRHIAKELGFDTKEAEKIGKIVGDLLKAAEPTDPQAAKRAAILRHRLAAVIAFARDTLVAEVEAKMPEATLSANLDAALAAIDTAAAAKIDRLAALEAA